ncbi:SufBD protein [Lacrimispora sp.]|uniref:SufBD protein n=1 Tax=Lacrimispora sp. TaxID=2719234 RepID=UPI0028AD3AD1|nr:SufBD protein [Lacrimispora sp.]
MDKIEELVNGLRNQDNNYAYQCLKQLEEECGSSGTVYPYFDVFTEMLHDPNSYVRTRGIILIAANAKWDRDNRIDEIIDELLIHVMDEKPVTARQCIKVLPQIAERKCHLAECIVDALETANPQRYKSSMQPLICKDIQTALESIKRVQREL